ncbi:MAG: hypothetical protein AAGI11_07170 [Pseudomonadota bacterium]
MKHLLAVPAFIFSINVMGACPEFLERPTSAPPGLPNGDLASAIDMHNAGVETRAYIAEIEQFLQCEPQGLSIMHNVLVERVEEAASAYNVELAKYRARQEIAATN